MYHRQLEISRTAFFCSKQAVRTNSGLRVKMGCFQKSKLNILEDFQDFRHMRKSRAAASTTAINAACICTECPEHLNQNTNHYSL